MEKHNLAIIRGIMAGKSNEEIAESLDGALAFQSIKQYNYIIFRQFGVKNRYQLVAKLIRKMVSEDEIENMLKGVCENV